MAKVNMYWAVPSTSGGEPLGQIMFQVEGPLSARLAHPLNNGLVEAGPQFLSAEDENRHSCTGLL